MTDRLDVHLYIHFHNEDPGSVTGRVLDDILTRVIALQGQEKHLMTTVDNVKQLVADLNTETNNVAAKLDAQKAALEALKQKVDSGSPVTQADLDAIADGLTPISDRLKALGADDTNPIPPPAPTA